MFGAGVCGFVVGFDERDDMFWFPCECGGDCVFLRCPCEVDNDEIDAVIGNDVWWDVHGVGAFVGDDARVVTEFPCERAVACVDGEDFCSVVLKEAISESAYVAAEVCTGEVGDIEIEVLECGEELKPPS